MSPLHEPAVSNVVAKNAHLSVSPEPLAHTCTPAWLCCSRPKSCNAASQAGWPTALSASCQRLIQAQQCTPLAAPVLLLAGCSSKPARQQECKGSNGDNNSVQVPVRAQVSGHCRAEPVRADCTPCQRVSLQVLPGWSVSCLVVCRLDKRAAQHVVGVEVDPCCVNLCCCTCQPSCFGSLHHH